MPPITGPGECVANDVVSLESVLLSDGHRVALLPSPVLRCSMAETVTDWVRDDVAPIIATLDTALRNVETLDSFVCRGRNGASGGKISEHGRANALDVRALKLADGRTIGLTDTQMSKPMRENLRQSACVRFTTVLGNGADAYHESHVHLDLLNGITITESASGMCSTPQKLRRLRRRRRWQRLMQASRSQATFRCRGPVQYCPKYRLFPSIAKSTSKKQGVGSVFNYSAPLMKQRC